MGDTVSGVVVINVNRGTPANERMLEVTASNLSQGQVLDVTSSLGRAGMGVTIYPTSAGFSVRFNSLRKNYPTRGDVGGRGNDLLFTSQLPNLAYENKYLDQTLPVISVASGQTLSQSGNPTESIEIVTCSGNFTILVQ